MERVDIQAEPNEPRTADVTKHLTEPLGLDDMAVNYFELAPGESFSGGLHTHMNQEEIFYILDGTATFETLDDEFDADADEIVRFAAGEYQEGRNDGDERVRALAMGAPQDAGETRTPFPCSECGADYHVTEVTTDGVTLICPDCDNTIET